MVLAGIRVLEFAGLAPAPMAGMILSDFGATVVRVDRVKQLMNLDKLARGKQSIAVDLKSSEGLKLVRRLAMKSDILIEPYRPGVMEKMGLGPKPLMEENPRLIYARITGFGQSGPFVNMAGHDINYLSMSGVLSMLGRSGEKPSQPLNLLADFAGGGMLCSMGILMALIQRQKNGKGQVVDASLTEGAAYVSSWLWRSQDLKMVWPTKSRGQNLLDGGAPFYDTYETKDGLYMAVGALEPEFYALLLKGLGLTEEMMPGTQINIDKWPAMKDKFTAVFAQKTQSEWCEVFDGTDACVTPVLTLEGASKHPHNVARGAFLANNRGLHDPRPAPVLSDSPAVHRPYPNPLIGQHTNEVLRDNGFTEEEISRLLEQGVIEVCEK